MTLARICMIAPILGLAAPGIGNAGTLHVQWPVAPGNGRVFDDNVAIVEGDHAGINEHCASILFTFSTNRLAAWDPASMRPLWPKSIECPFQPRHVFADADVSVFATPYELIAVERRGGGVAWRLSVMPGRNNAEDLVDADRWTRFAATSRSILAIDSRQGLVCIEAATGRREWTSQLESQPEQFAAKDSAVYCASIGAGDATLRTYRIDDGRLRNTVALKRSGPVSILNTTIGVVLCGATSIDGYDADGERRLWTYTPEKPLSRRGFTTHSDIACWLDADGRMTSLDLVTGGVRWSAQHIEAAGAEWLELSPDGRRLIAGRAGMLIGVDAANGELLWRHSGRPLPFAQPPICVGDDLLLVVHMAEPAHAASTQPSGNRLRLCRIGINDGMSNTVGPDGDIVTDRLTQFGGMTIRNNAILLLDGQRIIGYGSGNPRH